MNGPRKYIRSSFQDIRVTMSSAKKKYSLFIYWVAIRHFQLQATILEIYGINCVDEGFIDGQLYWLNKWQEAISEFSEGLKN